MNLPFYKYHGTGNDFVLLNGFENEKFVDLDELQIKSICDRHFGIGADGLMILQPHEHYDFEMIYFNSDGKRSSMCGNGGRCIVKLANKLNIIGGSTKFLAVDGPHEAKIIGEMVSLKMANISHIDKFGNGVALDTGSPHYVRIVSEIADYDICEFGKYVRYSDHFKKEGVNVNLVQNCHDYLDMKTYERGVENETLSCGTGVTAAVIASHYLNVLPENRRSFSVKTRGGQLSVSFETNGGMNYDNIWLTGPADHVFSGNFFLK